jgi:uncharacterized protein YndB with AHSA1/START domain
MSKPEFVYVTYIATTPEKVWSALQDEAMTRLYWGVKKNVSDWKVGSRWTHQDSDTNEVAVTGEVLESDPPRKLVVTWSHPGASEKSRVTYLLEPFMNAVKLTLTHDQLDAEMEKKISTGWPAILSSLKSLLETGQPLAMTTRRWGG